MYKTVIFDLGKVLVHFDFQPVYRVLAEHCPHAASRIPQIVGGTDLVERLETGRVKSHAFFEELRGLTGLRLNYDSFCAIWGGIFSDTLIPESMLRGLAARYRLLLLSNTNALHFELIRRKYRDHLRHFHAMVLSHEVHAMKPDPKIYQAVIEAAGCLPGECFYADDIPAFVEAGKAAGLDAVQFTGFGQLERDLRARGIEWED